MECELTILPRDCIISTGFRTLISVHNRNWIVKLDFIDRDIALSGETISSHVTFAYPSYLTEMLRRSKVFHVVAGKQIIAHCKVLKIIHLEESAVISKQREEWHRLHPAKETEYRDPRPTYKRNKDKK